MFLNYSNMSGKSKKSGSPTKFCSPIEEVQRRMHKTALSDNRGEKRLFHKHVVPPMI
jgi:hypothetical protein